MQTLEEMKQASAITKALWYTVSAIASTKALGFIHPMATGVMNDALAHAKEALMQEVGWYDEEHIVDFANDQAEEELKAIMPALLDLFKLMFDAPDEEEEESETTENDIPPVKLDKMWDAWMGGEL